MPSYLQNPSQKLLQLTFSDMDRFFFGFLKKKHEKTLKYPTDFNYNDQDLKKYTYRNDVFSQLFHACCFLDFRLKIENEINLRLKANLNSNLIFVR